MSQERTQYKAAPLLNVDQVAEQLGISRGTVYRRFVREGEIPSYRVGERLRFRQDEIDAYLERSRSD
jgi:excisionase family DNA binding protein